MVKHLFFGNIFFSKYLIIITFHLLVRFNCCTPTTVLDKKYIETSWLIPHTKGTYTIQTTTNFLSNVKEKELKTASSIEDLEKLYMCECSEAHLERAFVHRSRTVLWGLFWTIHVRPGLRTAYRRTCIDRDRWMNITTKEENHFNLLDLNLLVKH